MIDLRAEGPPEERAALERIPEREREHRRGLLAGLPVELPADVEAQGADGGVVARADADAGFEVAGVDVPPVGPDVAAVEKERAAEAAGDGETVVEVEQHEPVAAHWRVGVGLAGREEQGLAAEAQEVGVV